ncbi:MAG: AMP-binding protein, partial [Armatimonadetes bacterium]|nr:AMP-binding protein [Armatimonadota bacterium]
MATDFGTGLSYLSGLSQIPLLGETIGDNFDRTVARCPDRDAVVVPHQRLRYTYAELATEVDVCARALLALGIQPGDRVGIWAPNIAEWTVVQFAAAKVGAILVNLNPAYRLTELEFVLRRAGVRLLFFAPRVKTSDYVQMLTELIPGLQEQPARPERLHGSPFPDLQYLCVIDAEARPGCWSWSDLPELAGSASPDDLRRRQAALQFDDPINIQYTSGTTGFPKGATLSHHNLLNNGYFVGQRMRFSEQDRLCIPVPLYHCFGMVMGNLTCTSHGAAMVYPAPTFDPL